jgi:hypothetical protein
MLGYMVSRVAFLYYWAKETSLMAQVLECMVVAEQFTRVPLVSRVTMPGLALLCWRNNFLFFFGFLLAIHSSLSSNTEHNLLLYPHSRIFSYLKRWDIRFFQQKAEP